LALNNKPGVSKETRDKILALKYGDDYNPIEHQEKKNILLVVHKKHGIVISDTPFFMSLTETIQHVVADYGYSLKILHVNDSVSTKTKKENIIQQDALGFLLLGTELQDSDIEYYKGLKKPLVIIDSWFPNFDCDSVLMNNCNGIYQALNYAKSKGHKKIGFLKSSVCCNNFIERLEAFQFYSKKLGLKVKDQYIFEMPCTSEGVFNGMVEKLKELSEEKDFPTLFICSNDIMAIGLINAANSCNVRIPEDISVIGFDDMPIANYLQPPLTSIQIDQKEIGVQSISLLLNKINNSISQGKGMLIQVGVKLIERDSVKEL